MFYHYLHFFVVYHLVVFQQKLTKLCCGTSTVTDTVLYIRPQFGKSLVVAVGTEDGVVTEAFCTTPFTGNLTVNNALKQVLTLDGCAATRAHVLLLYEGYDSAETGTAVSAAVQFAQQAGHVGLTVVGSPPYCP